jgi:hypothetical protein
MQLARSPRRARVGKLTARSEIILKSRGLSKSRVKNGSLGRLTKLTTKAQRHEENLSI